MTNLKDLFKLNQITIFNQANYLLTAIKDNPSLLQGEYKDEILNYQDYEKNYLLHNAVSQNDFEGVKLLLENGADVHVLTSNGLEALDLLSINDNKPVNKDRIKELLLQKGAIIFNQKKALEKIHLPPLQNIIANINEIEEGIEPKLVQKLKEAKFDEELKNQYYSLSKDEEIEFNTLQNKKRIAWELALKNSEQYLQKEIKSPSKILEIISKDNTVFKFIDLRDRDDYQFFVHDENIESLENLKNKFNENSEIKIKPHFSASLIDKHMGTYRSTEPTKDIFKVFCLVLKIDPKSFVRGFAGDIYSPTVLGEDYKPSLKDHENSKNYIAMNTEHARKHNLKEYRVRKFLNKENIADTIDSLNIQKSLTKLCVSPEMKAHYNSQNSSSDQIIEEFPEFSPNAVLNNPHLRIESYNELVIKGNKNNEVVGVIFNELAINAVRKQLEENEDIFYCRSIKYLQENKIPMFIIRPELDKKYKLPYINNLMRLKTEIKENYRALENNLLVQFRLSAAIKTHSGKANSYYKIEYDRLNGNNKAITQKIEETKKFISIIKKEIKP
ncbi:MAG: hypothetical protein JWM09_208 [Francisellaceae bacterium]|nr:hypothetical protein [Francisellaceae bacterium]